MKPKHFFFTIFLVGIISILSFHEANAVISVDPAPTNYNDNGNYLPYKLIQDANQVSVASADSSFSFNKNTCSISFYNNPYFLGQPVIGNDNYTVLASQGSSGVWNPVSVINNAACSTNIIQSGNNVQIIGSKTVVGSGVFTINYTKNFGQPLKVSFSATNNNPAWTNFHIGLRDMVQVPQNITFGNQTYDLSLLNGTVLNRAWINSHGSQLINLGNHVKYNMGIGWNYASQITIQWINNKAYLLIDYTNNTPILSPGNTITVDPNITTDTITSAITASSSTNATQTIAITIGNNPNRITVVGISLLKSSTSSSNLNNDVISSVKIGSMSFTKAANASRYNATAPQSYSSEIWYGVGTPTGTVHITITPVTTSQYFMVAGAYSLYNVNQASPIGVKVTNGTSNNGTTTRTSAIAITPTVTGSWLIENIAGFPTTPTGTDQPRNPSDTQAWSAFDVNTEDGGSQYKTAPSIGSSNKMTWTFNTPVLYRQNEADAVIELRASNPPPSTPTLTHANTLNSTAIKLDWTSSTGATWYQVNYTSPVGGTFLQLVNQSGTSYTSNIFTPGTQYAFKVRAGNSTGSSAFTPFKSNYTTNIAPTNLVASLITATTARVSVTNPTGNFSGYKVYDATPNSGTFVLAGTTSNQTAKFDFAGLLGNQQYKVQFSTRYAVGTNSSGVSANSTSVSFYTLPNPPTGLTITQTISLRAHLSWTNAVDNGTINGFKIERSGNGGATWSTIVANTGNSTNHYDDTLSNAGTFSWRVSTIKYGGTSVPSNTATRLIWQYFTVNAFKADGISTVYGNAIQANSTSTNNIFPLVSGMATMPGVAGLTNVTIMNTLINFLQGWSYNTNATSTHILNITTNDFFVDCPFTGTGRDVEVFTNGTNGHKVTMTTPVCNANNTMKWSTTFLKNGNDVHSYQTVVYVKVLNATYLNNATLKWNQTQVATVLSNPYEVSAYVNVGTGLQTKLFNWSMNLTLNPSFVPANFTVGHLSVTGSNQLTSPIQLTVTKINSTMASVTAVFPTGYNMVYTAGFNTEQTSKTYTNVPASLDTPTLGKSTSTFFYKYPSNDTIFFTATDTISNNTASATINPPISSIPMVSQIILWKSGAYGTSGMFGPIDLVTFITIIIAFIGMNRVNETIGVVIGVMVMFAMGFFQLISYPTVMIVAVILTMLITIPSTKKLAWS